MSLTISGADDFKAYKYNAEKTLSWLKLKVIQFQRLLAFTSSFTHYEKQTVTNIFSIFNNVFKAFRLKYVIIW